MKEKRQMPPREDPACFLQEGQTQELACDSPSGDTASGSSFLWGAASETPALPCGGVCVTRLLPMCRWSQAGLPALFLDLLWLRLSQNFRGGGGWDLATCLWMQVSSEAVGVAEHTRQPCVSSWAR